METITIDGVNEEDFRRSIEDMLRRDEVDGAAEKLRGLLEPYAGDGGILPTRFLSVSRNEVDLVGWDGLCDRLVDQDRPDHAVSAVNISLTDPDGSSERPDEEGRLAPCIETSYFSDAAYPFSDATREDLLDGYSRYGCEWQGDSEGSDRGLALEGLDDLFGAIAGLEAQLLETDRPGEEEIRAGSLGACYLAVLVHQAVRDKVRDAGLPRPICVMAGCNGIYPYFDSPVTGSRQSSDDDRTGQEPSADVIVVPAAPAGRMQEVGEVSSGEASLLSLVSHKKKKKPVIVLDEKEAREAARFNEFAAAQQMSEGNVSARTSRPGTFPAAEPVHRTAAPAGTGNRNGLQIPAPIAGQAEPAARSIPMPGSGLAGSKHSASADEHEVGEREDIARNPEPEADHAGTDDLSVPDVPYMVEMTDTDEELVPPAIIVTEGEEADGEADLATPDGDAQSPQPVAGPRGHSLRAQIAVQREMPRASFRERAGTFMRRLARNLWRRGLTKRAVHPFEAGSKADRERFWTGRSSS